MTWHYNDGRVRVFETTNQVLKRYPLCNGMKTGYTERRRPLPDLQRVAQWAQR